MSLDEQMIGGYLSLDDISAMFDRHHRVAAIAWKALNCRFTSEPLGRDGYPYALNRKIRVAASGKELDYWRPTRFRPT
jgi:hypothetical protein